MLKPARSVALSLAATITLFAPGCKGNSPAPQRPISYQPAYQQPTYQQPAYQQPTYQQPAYQQPAYPQPAQSAPPPQQPPVAQSPTYPVGPTFSSPAPTAQGGTFAWQPTLQAAKSLARATRRMIFIEAGREACGNCQALKRRIIPTPDMSAALGSVAVGFYDDVDNSPYSESFNSLQQHLPGAAVLPLCGFFTADMQWVSGFSGHTDAGQFRNHIATAEATFRRMAMAQEPYDATTPALATAAPAFPDAELATVASANADNGEIDLGTTAAEAAAQVTPAVDTAPIAPLPPAADTPTTSVGIAAAPPELPAVTEAPPAPPTIAAPPAVEPAPVAATESVPAALERAVTALAARDYALARSILADVKARAAGTPERRDADKGEVAIYNLRRIDAASGAAQTALRAQARADLKNTVWASLFG